MAHSGPALTSAKSYACAYDTHPKVEYVPINQPGREVDCRGQSMVPRRCAVSGLAGSGTQLGVQPAVRRSTDAGPRVASERPLKLGGAGWEHIEASRNRGYRPELIAGRQESCGSDAQ